MHLCYIPKSGHYQTHSGKWNQLGRIGMDKQRERFGSTVEKWLKSFTKEEQKMSDENKATGKK